MGFIRWIFGFFLMLVIAGFAVANRNPALFVWSPVHEPLQLPVFVIGLGLMAAGFFLGSFVTWLNMGKLRRERRQQKKQIKMLEQKLEAVNENHDNNEAPSDFFPALIRNKKK